MAVGIVVGAVVTVALAGCGSGAKIDASLRRQALSAFSSLQSADGYRLDFSLFNGAGPTGTGDRPVGCVTALVNSGGSTAPTELINWGDDTLANGGRCSGTSGAQRVIVTRHAAYASASHARGAVCARGKTFDRFRVAAGADKARSAATGADRIDYGRLLGTATSVSRSEAKPMGAPDDTLVSFDLDPRRAASLLQTAGQAGAGSKFDFVTVQVEIDSGGNLVDVQVIGGSGDQTMTSEAHYSDVGSEQSVRLPRPRCTVLRHQPVVSADQVTALLARAG
jgi:hypothetical protein